jgi:hypothetical protein
MRRFLAPLYVLAVLGFVAYAGLVMAGVGELTTHGEGRHSGLLASADWQTVAFTAWLLACGLVVIGGTLAERRTRARR